MDDRLLNQLSDFAPAVREKALTDLLRTAPVWPAATRRVNLHIHTFFSYNGEGWSPARVAWEAKQNGLEAAGICDFDVLAGLEEWFDAADQMELRAAAGFESRVFFKEFAEHEINSPGEPGVFYFMGFGFAGAPVADSAAAGMFDLLLKQSHQRNRDMIVRINRNLGDLGLDYDRDVMPLTPAGNPTERHIVRAYHDRALAVANGDSDRAALRWADIFKTDAADLKIRLRNTNGFVDWLRSKMMKKGGLGYVQPTRDTFPPLDDVIRLILDCQAIPMMAYLDGASSGEADPVQLLEALVAKGIAAVNIIPDRNWNFKDPAEQRKKVEKFHEFMRTAQQLNLPVNAGTEMNKPGQRFVDDFEAEPMKPFHETFLEGGRIMVGQTRLLRFAGFSYTGPAAAAEFPEPARRNAFFAAVGALPAPSLPMRETLVSLNSNRAYAVLRDAAAQGRWPR